MNIPAHLISPCASKDDRCMGCGDAVKQAPNMGRWFITMGHPGFNSTANNGAGYMCREYAVSAMLWFAERRVR